MIRQRQNVIASLAVCDRSGRKSLPDSAGRPFYGIVSARPKLDEVGARVWLSPCNLNCIDILPATEIDDYPLRVQRVLFASERLSQIRIAFPIRFRITVCKS
jgi:hypothetical protein